MTVFVLAVAGSAGALARFAVSGSVQQRANTRLPIGTAVVNLAGAFLLGWLAGSHPEMTGWPLAAVGFLGGFTTFSTWMVETVELGVLPKPSGRAVANLVAMALLGVLLAALGYRLA